MLQNEINDLKLKCIELSLEYNPNATIEKVLEIANTFYEFITQQPLRRNKEAKSPEIAC